MIENTVLFNKDQTVLIAYPPRNIRETYRIPESVVKICENAFCWARYLKEVTIPDSVTDIGGCAFLGCDCEIVIGDGNKHYSSAFGSLYNKDKTELLSIPHGYDGVFIPKSVAKIDEMLFEDMPIDFNIICYKGSYVHEYAVKEGIDCILINERRDYNINNPGDIRELTRKIEEKEPDSFDIDGLLDEIDLP